MRSGPRYTRRMSKKLPVTDFRAVRSMLELHEFAISEGQNSPPSQLIDEEIWDGIMHLPEDVSIRISNHNGLRLQLMHDIWRDWIKAIGNPSAPDEIYNCMLDAAQCATFNFLHDPNRARRIADGPRTRNYRRVWNSQSDR